MNLNFANLTAPNGALTELSQLIFLKMVEDPELNQITRFMGNQKNGEKVGLLKGFGMLGRPSEGCEPMWENNLVQTSEQVWDIREWEIAEKICYETLLGTLAETATKNGVEIADLTGTQYIDDVLMPLLKVAIRKMILRYAFFGDKDITVYNASTNSSGTLVAGSNAKNFNVCDGFWKRIFALVAGGTMSRTTITANTQTTWATQRSAFRTAYYASNLLDDIIDEAPIKLSEASNRIILLNKFFWDAVKADVKKNNVGSELQYKDWFDGIQETSWQGIKVIVLPFWDEIIQNCLMNTTNTGAKMLPFRAIYTVEDNLLTGSKSKDQLNQIDYWFNKDEQQNKILAKDTVGTLILDHELIHVAY